MTPSSNSFRTLFGALASLLVVLLLAGCGGKKTLDPVPVGEMVEYRDAAIGFKIAYPKGWIQDAEVGTRARFFNAQGVDQKFLEPAGPYPDGVMINLEVSRTTSADSVWKAQVSEMNKMGFVLAPEASVTLAGKPAVKVPYTGAYTAKVKETGFHIYFNADTLLYDIRCAGFGPYFDAYAAIFDAALASFEFPKPVEKGRDATLPSDILSDHSTPLFSFKYPDNFNFESISKGNNELAIALRGANKSTSIQFTVFPAKGLTLEKVFEQNKGKFAGATTGKATVGGQPAMMLTYSATREVDRRFYFVVRNDKVTRITLDWVKSQSADYLAAYDKVIGSVQFK